MPDRNGEERAKKPIRVLKERMGGTRPEVAERNKRHRKLRTAGVEFGYLYEKEMYSGALLHDQAVDNVFARHARRVAEVFSKEGVRGVITVDPHTTNMLRSVYPEIVPGFDVEVRSYLGSSPSPCPPRVARSTWTS